MTFTKANPAGWALFELLTSAQMNTIDGNMVYALDGRAGGVYTPTAALELSSASLATGKPLLKLHAPVDVTQYALEIALDIGSAQGLHIANTIGIGSSTWLKLEGTDIQATSVVPASMITADRNLTGPGAVALRATGGESHFATASAGNGIHAIGGAGSVANTFGGIGVHGVGGASDLTSKASGSKGASGLLAWGGGAIGANANHYGGFGLVALGGLISSTGKGGFGVLGTGALGPANNAAGTDVGVGVAGQGLVGLRGANMAVDPISAASEFNILQRAGIQAAAKTYGFAVYSQFSGSSNENSLNLFEAVGSATGVASTVMDIRTRFTSGSHPSGTIIGLSVDSQSSVDHKFSAIDATSVGAPSLRATTTSSGDSTRSPHLQLVPSTVAFTAGFEEGGLGFLEGGTLTGLTDACLFVGSGSSADTYDRVVTSADKAAAWAWAKAHSDGSGGITLTVSYNVQSVSLTTVGGTPVVQFTLKTITGGPTEIMAVGGTSSVGLLVDRVHVPDATHVNIASFVPSSSVFTDFHSVAQDIWFIAHAASSYGSRATQPTFFRA